MNKTKIKSFAIWARNKLIADITYKAGLMGISEKEIKPALPQSTDGTEFYDIGTKEPYAISGEAVNQRGQLVELINRKATSSDYSTAFHSVIEEVAYTWFNRLIAIRFMEVNDYLPSHIRVLSSESAAKLEPDLVTTPFDAELELTQAEKEEIIALKNENRSDELFRLLFIKQCNALNALLPKLFEKTADYSELLLNVSVTDQDGVVYHLVHDIEEDDFNIEKGGQVEIIGWLYQYYNTEPKDETFALLKKNVKITKERIPAATQLFTPDWIVRYMVENSLGRLWIEHLQAGEDNVFDWGNFDWSNVTFNTELNVQKIVALKEKWKYYLDEAKQEPEVEKQLAEICESYKDLKPEDIKVIDPCMGSGHILVYAFDVLMQIYESTGYSQRDAAKSILEHNLYGLDIDDRAFQLACFAVMMKARQYNRRILNGEAACHVYSIPESNGVNRSQLKYFGMGLNELEKNDALNQMNGLLDTFIDAKEYGSILNVENYDWDLLRRFAEKTSESGQLSMDSIGLESTKEQLQLLIDIGQTMTQKYEVVVTNPPYMSSSGMGEKLYGFAHLNYLRSNADISTIMMEKAMIMCKTAGYMTMINIPVWMSIPTYANFRETFLRDYTLINMSHNGRGIFGSDFGSVAFVFRNISLPFYAGTYCRLFIEKGQVDSVEEKEKMYLEKFGRYTYQQCESFDIPGLPLAYWESEKAIKIFQKTKLVVCCI